MSEVWGAGEPSSPRTIAERDWKPSQGSHIIGLGGRRGEVRSCDECCQRRRRLRTGTICAVLRARRLFCAGPSGASVRLGHGLTCQCSRDACFCCRRSGRCSRRSGNGRASRCGLGGTRQRASRSDWHFRRCGAALWADGATDGDEDAGRLAGGVSWAASDAISPTMAAAGGGATVTLAAGGGIGLVAGGGNSGRGRLVRGVVRTRAISHCGRNCRPCRKHARRLRSASRRCGRHRRDGRARSASRWELWAVRSAAREWGGGLRRNCIQWRREVGASRVPSLVGAGTAGRATKTRAVLAPPAVGVGKAVAATGVARRELVELWAVVPPPVNGVAGSGATASSGVAKLGASRVPSLVSAGTVVRAAKT